LFVLQLARIEERSQQEFASSRNMSPASKDYEGQQLMVSLSLARPPLLSPVKLPLDKNNSDS
jgi:hypothetical protein